MIKWIIYLIQLGITRAGAGWLVGWRTLLLSSPLISEGKSSLDEEEDEEGDEEEGGEEDEEEEEDEGVIVELMLSSISEGLLLVVLNSEVVAWVEAELGLMGVGLENSSRTRL